jgi:hypothetical protein
MRSPSRLVEILLIGFALGCASGIRPSQTFIPSYLPHAGTTVSIRGDSFFLNDRITYRGRVFRRMKAEGLLFNSRMVEGIFDDLNPQTRDLWNYPNGRWDANRNTAEFIAAMPSWRQEGLLSFTINLQGGNPQGYGDAQPWINSAIAPDGSLRPQYMARLQMILDKADELGMAPILGIFYFGQEPRLAAEAAVVRATDNAVDWVLAHGYRNVMIEIANECDNRNYHAILRPPRADELIRLVQQRSNRKVQSPAGRLLVSTSFGGGVVPTENVIAAADFILMHGNGVSHPDRIRQMIDDVRHSRAYRGQPILFNEDDHYAFDQADNNLLAALSRHASWGYFDYRRAGEPYRDGFQSVPVDWSIDSPRKKAFFGLVRQITGGE